MPFLLPYSNQNVSSYDIKVFSNTFNGKKIWQFIKMCNLYFL